MDQLKVWYGANMPAPINSYVTRWWNDPWSGGSYSYQSTSCTGVERNAFATPEPTGPNPRVWFAGEHTHAGYPATMQGAFLSGRRAAQAVAKQFPRSG